MLLIVTVGLVLAGIVLLVIGLVQDHASYIYFSMGCAVVAAITLFVFTRLARREGRGEAGGARSSSSPEPAVAATQERAPADASQDAPTSARPGDTDAVPVVSGSAETPSSARETSDRAADAHAPAAAPAGRQTPDEAGEDEDEDDLDDLDFDELDDVDEGAEVEEPASRPAPTEAPAGRPAATEAADAPSSMAAAVGAARAEVGQSAGADSPGAHTDEAVAVGSSRRPAGGPWAEESDWEDDEWDDEIVFPIEDYDDLRVAEILPILGELEPDELEDVRNRESAGKARGTILRRIEGLLGEGGTASAALSPPAAAPPGPPPAPASGPGASAAPAPEATSRARPAPSEHDEPIPGYDTLRVAQILPLLSDLDGDELARLEEHERSESNRATVLTRIARLRAGKGAGVGSPGRASAVGGPGSSAAVGATSRARQAAAARAAASARSTRSTATPAAEQPTKRQPAKKQPGKAAPARRSTKKRGS